MAVSNSITQCLQALEVLAAEASGLPLVEIARRLDLSKGGTHRLLTAMVAANFVKQDPLSHHYMLTLRLTTLGFRFLAGTQVIDLCQPVLDRLAAQTSELVRMTMAEGDRIAWVAKAQGSRTGLRFDPEMGREVHVHSTASGRVWLAGQSTQVALRILMRQGLGSPDKFGPNAPKTVEQFLAALQQTRDQGYGLAIDEDEPGMSAIAVPIARTPDAPPVGTVSVAGPTARLSREKLIGFLGPLRQTASELAAIWSFARLGQDAPSVPSGGGDNPIPPSKGGPQGTSTRRAASA